MRQLMLRLRRTVLLVGLLGSLAQAQDSSAGLRRIAVVVGSNSAVQSRPGLRFSHADARSMAQVFRDVGHFAPHDVTLLLDPTPADVLGALDAALDTAKGLSGKVMLVFYYSGHADTDALFPNGQPLALAELKERLTSESAELRVGIIDSCRGGGWTQAKGLHPTQPFTVVLPAMESTGTVLLSSSSGLEDAHEAEVLQGSFFTHNLVTALRGAADESRDGQVSLAEAIAYTSEKTIRDTAQLAKVPQHPSFDVRLHGRRDLMLTDVASSSSLLTVVQKKGPLQIVQLATGQVVVEAPQGTLVLRLALPAGGYLVRRLDGNKVLSREVSIVPGKLVQVEEGTLELTGLTALAFKGLRLDDAGPPWDLSAGLGLAPFDAARTLSAEAAVTWRVMPRFAWRIVRAHYVGVLTGGVREQFERDFGGVPVTLQPALRFRIGSDAVAVLHRSQRTASGFQVESMIALGPSVVGFQEVRSALGLAVEKVTVAPGASLEALADFRLPFSQELHLRPSVAGDLWYVGGKDALTARGVLGLVMSFRFAITLAWRWGA